MAIVKHVPTGNYGVVELNKLESVKDGNIIVQYDLDSTDFTSIPAENGMLLRADHVTKTVALPDAVTDDVYLHASVEKDYEGKGRKYFAVKKGELLPRLFRLKKGDIIETNCFQYDTVAYADYAAIKAAINATTVFGVPSTAGYIDIKAATTATAVVELKVVGGVTLPNGQTGLKFVVVKA